MVEISTSSKKRLFKADLKLKPYKIVLSPLEGKDGGGGGGGGGLAEATSDMSGSK